MFNIEENVNKLPESPGVYLHKDQLGNVIYVGKAVSLKSRVRQYFQSTKKMDPKVKAMVSKIAEFEYITTGSEMEALILECNLIKKYMPKYNVLLRDDKTYPYIKVSTSEPYPRIQKTRIIGKGGDKFFGPYSDAGAVNRTVELLNQVYRLKRCNAVKFNKNAVPCLHYHIHQCDGICVGKGNQEEYLTRVESAMDFLKGKNKNLITYLRKEMTQASDRMDYEEAGRYRDLLQAAAAIHEKQRVVLHDTSEIDVILTAGINHIVVFYVREGKLSGRDTFDLETGSEENPKEVLSAFLKQHYGSQGTGPSEMIFDEYPSDQNLLEEYFQARWNRKVKMIVPQKGEKKALLELAKNDVTQVTKNLEEQEKNKAEKEQAVQQELKKLLARMKGVRTTGIGLNEPDSSAKNMSTESEYRVEAYDLSNTNGLEAVGAMVVFRGSKAEKKAYRRFKIRTIDGPDDYASLQEVLYRRLKRGNEKDPGFSELPDLILVDGGKGHVHAAMTVLDAMHVSRPIAGMVKDEKHRSKGLVYLVQNHMVEEALTEHPVLYRFIGTVQEEVHRFAVDYHRNVRDKKSLVSQLDQIEGIGPSRRNALLEHFGSLENIKKADVDDLSKVPGISEAQGKRIWEYFH